MIFGKLEINGSVLETSNDSYALASVSAASTRRPFLISGLMVGTLVAAFALSFWDILYLGERIASLFMSAAALWSSLNIGRLQLTSRDLRGSELADANFGTYRHLNRERPRILAAAANSKSNTKADDAS